MSQQYLSSLILLWSFWHVGNQWEVGLERLWMGYIMKENERMKEKWKKWNEMKERKLYNEGKLRFRPNRRAVRWGWWREVKKKYLTFTGKTAQDVGCVTAIYQFLSRHLQTNFPHIKYIIDKSDNAGCYHNEVLFTWKTIWSKKP